MQLTISREKLLKPLQLIAGVVERRQTLPILSNVLLILKKNELSLAGTDLEVELIGRVELDEPAVAGKITVPARKLMDICRSLPDQAEIEFELDDTKLKVRSGRSRFNLVTLPANDFPIVEEAPGQIEFVLPQQDLRKLIERTQFAMAQQDVRYYLNGMLWEVKNGNLSMVSTDGHRLAMCTLGADIGGDTQVIVPRKAVLELARLLTDSEDSVTVMLGANQLRVKTNEYTFTSKLIDGRFPDYEKVIPRGGDKVIEIDRDFFKQALSRVGILANEKHRSVRLELRKDLLRVIANNPEQEQAEEELNINYQGDDLDIGFNITYLIEALSALPAGTIHMTLSNSDSSARVEGADGYSIYVVMPMRI